MDPIFAGLRRARLSKVMSCSTGWHTFRRTYTTGMHANGEDVKVVQERLRHGSAHITMGVYAQAVTPAKRKAQGKVAPAERTDLVEVRKDHRPHSLRRCSSE